MIFYSLYKSTFLCDYLVQPFGYFVVNGGFFFSERIPHCRGQPIGKQKCGTSIFSHNHMLIFFKTLY